jgi:hypothetical protein
MGKTAKFVYHMMLSKYAIPISYLKNTKIASKFLQVHKVKIILND